MPTTEQEFEWDWGLALKMREELGRMDGIRQLLNFLESGRSIEDAKRKFAVVEFMGYNIYKEKKSANLQTKQ
ncbi:MAG: hypothetical protein FWF51_03305 [Chitinivibrionia bacterium]|nr:hypothetical protein [Chitinivibrionia bacterium]